MVSGVALLPSQVCQDATFASEHVNACQDGLTVADGYKMRSKPGLVHLVLLMILLHQRGFVSEQFARGMGDRRICHDGRNEEGLRLGKERREEFSTWR